jgi:hypothetical protein
VSRRRATFADLEEFARLQRELARALADRSTSSLDDPLTWPRSGEVLLSGATWRFTRHGRGYRFEHSRGARARTVVDFADGMPSEWAIFDAWRIKAYLASLNALPPVGDAENAPLLDAVDRWLRAEVDAGRLEHVEPRRFRLVTVPR